MPGTIEGRILQCNGGFYYVEAAAVLYECRARGLFRKSGITPLAGDRAVIATGEDTQSQPRSENSLFEKAVCGATVVEILPRRNSLIRPPVANLDLLGVVAAVASPSPNLLVIDRMLAIAESKGIEPLLIINKTDLEQKMDDCPEDDPASIYRSAGFEVYEVSAQTGEGVEALRRRLAGFITAFTGNSGVGKSSLLNAMLPGLRLPTGDISRKLGRGRHTTRSATLHPLEDGGYIVDTPGFSSVDTVRAEPIRKEELASCFREFEPYTARCRYGSCTHVREEGCAVIGAVEQGRIAPSRHLSYRTMYEEVKDIGEWERK